jgi:hypothetical protein
MKKFSVFFSVVILIMISACSQNKISNQAEFKLKDKADYDFGKIAYDSDGSYEFKFTNTGKEPLIITNVKSSCGCTIPTYPKEPIEVGATSGIKVKYDTKRAGNFSKTITVYANTKDSPITLHIKGEVEPQKGN